MTDPFRQQIDAAASGDRHAFDSLFARNLPKLIAYIRVRMGPDLAARESVTDLAQSVCREVLLDAGDFEYRGEESFRKWLFMQATRKLIDRHRFHRRERRDVRREVQPAGGGSTADHQSILTCYADLHTPSRVATAKDQLDRIEGVLHRLPENQREAIALARLVGLPTAEIAARLGCTDSAVRGLIARGLARLAIELGEGESQS
jgi:RNA polymerase sigma-70 factor (ECF subfamily)